tara:strand:+ start:1912 stop:3372 length:1461 start_codon:yes stop_codon:yes gene_type:complete
MPNFDYDVVIVGLGPTGGVLANLIAKHNLSIKILEKENQLYNLPRAVHFDDEIMRVFETIGISENFLKQTIINKGTRFIDENNNLLLDWPRPKVITENGWYPSYRFHQPDLERNLRKKLSNFKKVSISQNSDVFNVENKKDHVEVTYKNVKTEKENILRSKYVIGCDGGRSFVRKAIDAGIDDLGFEQRWAVIDVLLKTKNIELPDRTIQYCSSSRPATYCRNVGRRRRWEIALKDEKDEKQFLREENLWKFLNRWVSKEDIKIERKAVYTFQSAIAKKWQKGRIFLAGDAAHLSPPFMGQGMCAGIRDASNLAWKIAFCCQNEHNIKLLNSYQSERYKNVKEYILTTMNMGKLLNEMGGTNVSKTVKNAEDGSKTMSTIKPSMGPGLGSLKDKNRGKIFPNIKFDKNKTIDEFYDKKIILFSKKNYNQNNISNVSGDKFEELIGILKKFNSEALIVRPDRYILSSTNENNNINDFVEKTLSSVYN